MSFEEWVAEGEYIDEINVVGFEYVRSDVATVTADVQHLVLESILLDGADAAKETCISEITNIVTRIMEDDYPLEDVGITFGIGQPLSEYGSADRRPQYKYRGAKYSNDYIYEANAIGEGDRPMEFRVDAITGQRRKTFDAATAEHGDYVDSIAVLDVADIPKEIHIDRRSMIEKTVFTPIEDIFEILGWSMEPLQRAMDDATPPEYYRDEDQLGFGSFSAADAM